MGIDNSNSQSEIFHRVNLFWGVKFEFPLDCLEITIVIFYSGEGFKIDYKSVVVRFLEKLTELSLTLRVFGTYTV